MSDIPHVLIVEDEPDLRSVYVDALSTEGYQLETAVDGDDAVTKILKGGWDVILLDIVMPKKNGFDVLETIKRTITDATQREQIMESVIFLTNLDNMTDLTHALSLGPKEYVVKTQVTPGQIQDLVRSFIEKKVHIGPQPVAVSAPAAPTEASVVEPHITATPPPAPVEPPVVDPSVVTPRLPVSEAVTPNPMPEAPVVSQAPVVPVQQPENSTS